VRAAHGWTAWFLKLFSGKIRTDRAARCGSVRDVFFVGDVTAMSSKPTGAPAADRFYYAPTGGHPEQTEVMTDRAIFTDAYAVIPKGVMRDIVTSSFPFWDETRAWILARPLSGFAETFSQYIMEVGPGGGSNTPEPDNAAEGALFVMEGTLTVTIDGNAHQLRPGGFAYLPPAVAYTVGNTGAAPARFHWIRKHYEAVAGLDVPEAFVTSDADITPTAMPGTEGRWATTRFIDPADMRHDMHVTIVTFQPGALIPFAETHVMEHGLYVLEGKGVYRLNADWVEVEAGDFMWLRAFCPQACYAGGPGPFRYLLYKDVNRHPRLGAPRSAL
jgi:(S)-ureidoglycine aminohydrolase